MARIVRDDTTPDADADEPVDQEEANTSEVDPDPPSEDVDDDPQPAHNPSADEEPIEVEDVDINDPVVETDDGPRLAAHVDLDALDYRELQAIAGEFSEIAGNQSAEDLREALDDRRESEE